MSSLKNRLARLEARRESSDIADIDLSECPVTAEEVAAHGLTHGDLVNMAAAGRSIDIDVYVTLPLKERIDVLRSQIRNSKPSDPSQMTPEQQRHLAWFKTLPLAERIAELNRAIKESRPARERNAVPPAKT